MKQKGFALIFILVGILIVAAIGSAYYFGKNTSSFRGGEADVAISPAPSSSPSDETSNWKTYNAPNGRFSFKYPSETKINENNENSILKLELWGENQKEAVINPNFEGGVIDGLSMTFSLGKFKGKSLKEVANEKAKIEQQPDQLITPTSIIINNNIGYFFSAPGRSLIRYIFLSKNTDTYVEINYYTEGTSEDKFNTQADQILSTFKFTE